VSRSVPAISVCIPTYQRARQLPTAIGSVLGQTRQDFEIIVSDDASTDETASVVASFGDRRIRYRRNRDRLGIAENRNRCLDLARGRYIAWLDSDDAWCPQMLEQQSRVLDTWPGVALAHGAFHVMDGTGRRLADWPMPAERDAITPGPVAFRELVLCNFVTAPTVMIRRRFHDLAGRYDPSIGRASTDWDMWLRLVRFGDIAYSASPVAFYRYHADSVSASTTGNAERLRCDLAVVRRAFADVTGIHDARVLEARARAALAARAIIEAGDSFAAGRKRDATRALRLAARAWPRLLLRPQALRLFTAQIGGFEYASYRASRALLAELHSRLEGSRFAETLHKRARVSSEWDEELRSIAATVRTLVPRRARLAVADKHDPTILSLSRRRGWHFPDLRLMPEGYPPDDDAAIRHLNRLQGMGTEYLVFPSAAFWWLDHYGGLRRHLDTRCSRIWRDERCIMYRLGASTADGAQRNRADRPSKRTAP
jgi:glycosyltransferase involved in cell wall biosynthesis